MINRLRTTGYQIEFVSHAKAILEADFPSAMQEIGECLLDFRIPIHEIIGSGGGEAQGTQRLRNALNEKGWIKLNFEIKKIINGIEKESISHEVDHVKTFDNNSTIALEIEWNNKDPFFDRDLENFKRLHAEGAISVGVIITRGTTLQSSLKEHVQQYARDNNLGSIIDLRNAGISLTDRQDRIIQNNLQNMTFSEAWAKQFVSDKFGEATTHWRKLEDRVSRGVGNPCPLLLIGIPSSVIVH
ncbi:BglII/BstYI family type II restriction endonuclease [Sulfuricurvum sp.]|uniref:BglII/BstYI family type II restriction endonuclease n=1 Tax=Sulfuricurvum sp. TaxID=2025608 RepID=UPI0026101AD0|nr:BglII/BstYI family type II restriction endonuclease [Sulfuricurvum sp.]MDD3598170.1 BglII/BstYI family type II restriction endonuclease [Sulfuricurvum sp.]